MLVRARARACRRRSWGNLARVLVVTGACIAAIGSASSNQQNPQPQTPGQNGPPPPQQMEPARALGLWRSNFGAVKIEADDSKGGLQSGAVQGVWVYNRRGEEVIGYFAGTLRGNVLEFTWQEPNDPPLTGGGYLVFDQQGRQYNGRWWSERRDRVGDWNGWRGAGDERPNSRYGGATDGDPYGRDPYNRDPYGRDPYGRDPQRRDPSSRDPYGRDPYGRDPYGRDPNGRDPNGRAPYGRDPRDPYGREPYGREPAQRDPYGRDPYGRDREPYPPPQPQPQPQQPPPPTYY